MWTPLEIGALAVAGLALVACLDPLLPHFQRMTSMPQTLGDDFSAYLNAQSAVNSDQAKLAADQATLATSTFHVDLVNSGVKALLAPSANPDGSLPVAIVNPDGSFTVIVAAAPSTPIPAQPTPAPNN